MYLQAPNKLKVKKIVLISIGLFLWTAPIGLMAQADTSGFMKHLLPGAITGVIRAKYEQNTSNGKGRFDVRNARFGMKGNVGRYFGYKFEIDFCDEGKIKMLDVYADFVPVKNLTFSLGQMKAPFSTEYLLNPSRFEFANRPFIDKRICMDLRDIGFKITYDYVGKIPFSISGFIMNGTGVNNPEWTTRLAAGGRALITPFKGFTLQAQYLAGTIGNKKTEMQGYGIRYEYQGLIINTEYAQKTIVDTASAYTQNSLFAYVLYNFQFTGGMIKTLTPALRYDFFSGNIKTGIYEPHRLTAGLTLGFHKLSFANIRFNYEKYFYQVSQGQEDKFTVEFMVKF